MNFYILLFIIGFCASMAVLNAVKAFGQSDEGPLRYLPKLNEDEIIICAADYKHKNYYGQVSCIVSDDGLDNPTLRKLGDKATSLKNTFEMGLID